MNLKSGTEHTLKHWQYRIFTSVWITYFSYYLCRYNMSMAKTPMTSTFGWDAGQFGTVFSALTIMYAVGQFVNGQLADRFGTRGIASIGALGSVLTNLAVFAVVMAADPETVDTGRLLLIIVLFWGLNGFFQAMGWSPMVRVMAHWFSLKRRGKIMGLMGTCYQFGGAFSWLLAYFLIRTYPEKFGGDWRVVFLVPSVLFAAAGTGFFMMIRNSPEEVGLPPVDADRTQGTVRKKKPARTITANIMRTLKNPYLWIIAMTFFLLDMNRYGFVNWLPAYLDEVGGPDAGTYLSYFKDVMKRIIHPLAGSAGAVLAGWATDRFFGGRRAPVIAVLLVFLGLFSIIFPYIDPRNSWLMITVVALIGFCTYGPHILMVGHAAQDFGKKSGAAGAAGFIDGMGYIGASLAGWGAGELIDAKGYNFTFTAAGIAAILGAVLISLIWKVKPRTGD